MKALALNLVALLSLASSLVGQSSSGLLNMPSVTAFGAVGDGKTDNTCAIDLAINSLAPGGGALYFPPNANGAAAVYNFSGACSNPAATSATQVIIPRNVTIWCLAPDAVILNYTGTTAAFAWADNYGTSLYHRGGMRDCTLNGPVASTIGIFAGGDPITTRAITPSTWYGDFLTFVNDKIQYFGVGYELGNNTWENDFISTLFTNNPLGWYVPSGLTNSGENVAMHGGAIQNGTNAVSNQCMCADIVLDSISIDGMAGSAVISGNASTTTYGGTVELNSPHIEYFASTIPAPIFYVYGIAQLSAITVRDGWIQFDSSTETAVQALAQVCDTPGCNAGNGSPHTVGFTLSGTQIHAGAGINWELGSTETTCAYTSPGICIEGDISAQDAVIGPYSYWTGTSFGSPNGSQFLPGLQNLIQYHGTAQYGVPTCNATTPMREVCAIDAHSCVLGTAYSAGSSVHCTLACDGTSWKETGIQCQ